MKLHVLPGGEVPLAASELVCDSGELPKLNRSQQPAGDLRSHHLYPCLPLAVDATAETMGAQFVVSNLAGEPGIRLASEEFYILPDGPIILLFKELLFRTFF
jgi:hypothetical protein